VVVHIPEVVTDGCEVEWSVSGSGEVRWASTGLPRSSLATIGPWRGHCSDRITHKHTHI